MGFFVNDRKYIIGNEVRIRMKIAKANQLFQKMKIRLGESSESLYYDEINNEVYFNSTH